MNQSKQSQTKRFDLPEPILVTGAGGFIGSHLVESLVRQGFKVRGFVHYNAQGDWGWLEQSPARNDMEVLAGDIRDLDSVLGVVRGCGTVFHLAALIGIPYSYLSPVAYLRTNVEGSYNLLEAARLSGVDRIIVTSTSETYGTAQTIPMNEEHPLRAQSPYAASKIAADQFALSYHRSFGSPVWIVRPFNAYGPRQSARAFIPAIISQILAGAKEIRVGNLKPRRDLTYVQDTVEGFLAIASCMDFVGTVTHIGTGQDVSMREILEEIMSLMGEKPEIVEDQDRIRSQESEVDRLLCDNARIRRATDWKPKYELSRGLGETIEWMGAHLHSYKPETYHV